MIEAHDGDWDSLHMLATIERDGDGIRFGTMAALDPAIDPDLYPAMIGGIAAKAAADGNPPYALFLQIEAFGAQVPPEDAPGWEQDKFDADRSNRTIHARPDAVEAVWAWVVDVHGQTWCAKKVRGKEDVIEESFYPAGSTDIGGNMPQAMHDSLKAVGSAG
jgi:hypothetical protein